MRFPLFKDNGLDVKKDEFVCDKCKGERKIRELRNITPNITSERFVFCPKCLGAGKLNWVENVVGKRSLFDEGDNEAGTDSCPG